MTTKNRDRAGRPDSPLRDPRVSPKKARIRKRRKWAALGLLLVAGGVLAAGVSHGGGSWGFGARDSESVAKSESTTELPRGGTELLPAYRLVGFYGAPQDPQLGALGIGTPAEASRKLTRQARAYRGKRPLQPFFELIATIANADPGADGLYRTQQPRSVIRDYLKQARADRNLLVLDIQPGRAEFPAEIARLKPYLRQPDVGLGLDPEWRVGSDGVPGQVIGSMSAAEINRIAARLSRIVRANKLPQKLLIVHQFTDDMITNPKQLRPHPGVAIVLNVDGFGTPAEKKAKYRDLHAKRHSGLLSGFKLFYEEDTGLMDPEDVLEMKPRPDLVVYE